MILLDTHVLVWALTDPSRLGRKAARLLEQAGARDELAVSAVSFLEIALLGQKPRATARREATAIRAEFQRLHGQEIAVDADIALRAGELEALRDLFDRLIVATAEVQRARLVTADSRILDWPAKLPRQHAQE